MMTTVLYRIAFIICLTSAAFCSQAQNQPLISPVKVDSTAISLDSAEQIFLRNNLLLLAQRYNIDAQKALIIQAKLWPNPNLAYARGPIFGIHDQFSNVVNAGFFNYAENTAAISQLILLAGKRNKQIKLAEANVKLAEYQFYDLLRTLKYTLRTDFFNIYYLQQSAKVYNKEISAMQQVVTAFESQQGKGYIAEKEVVRIKAQLYSLQSEYNDLINQINDTQSELRLVMQVKNLYISPIVDTQKNAALDPAAYSLTTLVDTAFKSRTDLKIARANTQISKLNYNYQKALAVPDLTASLGYDRLGSYVQNFHSVGVSMDLPIFNRNQGNIKSAKAMIQVNQTTEKSVEASVEEQLYRALQKAYDNNKLYKNIDPKFSGDFDRLLNEVLINYQRRNIGLLDFLDFYDAYKSNILQINSIQFNRISAFEDINFYTGTNFYN
ncbi:MAG: TolC family protein [Sediminibacterium magnilacihabitans]|jgi:cobalt-zinc-cadmium efflux system outer membrane protein|nr:TolC family protein [Sediminibacterium magnilacihabitans]PQV61265.1 cobalt-zinc-cadmium efflux system outer membrane protein [Sediminibacterium magnilacihabitans]